MADRRKYDSSGKNLLLMIVFTIVNLLLLAFNVDIGFAFSAVVPQLVLSYGPLPIYSALRPLFWG